MTVRSKIVNISPKDLPSSPTPSPRISDASLSRDLLHQCISDASLMRDWVRYRRGVLLVVDFFMKVVAAFIKTRLSVVATQSEQTEDGSK